MKKRVRTNAENALLVDLQTIQERYQVSRVTARKLAEESGTLVKVGRCVRVNQELLDEYLLNKQMGDSNNV